MGELVIATLIVTVAPKPMRCEISYYFPSSRKKSQLGAGSDSLRNYRVELSNKKLFEMLIFFRRPIKNSFAIILRVDARFQRIFSRLNESFE